MRTLSFSSPYSLVRAQTAPSASYGIELGDRSRDLGLDDRLPLPRVDPDPEPQESRLDLAQHPRHGVSVRVRELVDVGTVVAVLGGLLATPARGHRLTEPLHLPAGVVEVVLLLDRVGGEREQSSHAVAVRAVPRRADRERAGRIRRDELDLDPLGRRGRPRAVVARRGEHLRERLAVPGLTHREVEKPRPCDVDPLDEIAKNDPFGHLLGDLARRAAEKRSEPKRNRRRVVAVPWIARAFERDLHRTVTGELARCDLEGCGEAPDGGGSGHSRLW